MCLSPVVVADVILLYVALNAIYMYHNKSREYHKKGEAIPEGKAVEAIDNHIRVIDEYPVGETSWDYLTTLSNATENAGKLIRRFTMFC